MSTDDKKDEQKTERFNMFMSPSEMKAIEDWAWENRIRSKSEAVRRLCQIALTLEESQPKLKDQLAKLTQSSDEAKALFEKWEEAVGGIENPEVREQADAVTDAALESMVSMFGTLEAVLEFLRIATYFRADHEMEVILKDVDKAKKRLEKRLEQMLNP